jgi:hypothetical protein
LTGRCLSTKADVEDLFEKKEEILEIDLLIAHTSSPSATDGIDNSGVRTDDKAGS